LPALSRAIRGEAIAAADRALALAETLGLPEPADKKWAAASSA
jgi:hypothetical protein